MAGLLAFDADQHIGAIAPLAISKGVRIFLPYYKLFSPADRDAIFAAGAAAGVEVGIIPIFETTAERALGGASAGSNDADAIAAYMNSVRQPLDTAFVLTFDFDEQTAQDLACRAYAAAVHAGVDTQPMIAYGNGALTEELKAAGIAKFSWVAGGMGMRGTRADIAGGNEDMQQDVGDVRGLHLGIEIDSDFAPHATSPRDLCAWMATPPPEQWQQPTQQTGVDKTALLKTWQATLGVTADGIWGPNTAAAFAAYFGDDNG
ncbi:MAG TPA: hypothetical protein VKS24_25095 [Bradyrhizobium sp.]|nr:hypothetical protein [Bradyrhizobium sp.]